jgi:hypothetical protein
MCVFGSPYYLLISSNTNILSPGGFLLRYDSENLDGEHFPQPLNNNSLNRNPMNLEQTWLIESKVECNRRGRSTQTLFARRNND